MRNVTSIVLSKPILQIVRETDVKMVSAEFTFQDVYIMKGHTGLPSRSSELLPLVYQPAFAALRRGSLRSPLLLRAKTGARGGN